MVASNGCLMIEKYKEGHNWGIKSELDIICYVSLYLPQSSSEVSPVLPYVA